MGWCCPVAQLCLTLYNPMDRSTPGSPVFQYLPEFAQTPLSRWCHPTISSSVACFFCPQSFPAPCLFQWVGSLHQVRFSISPSSEHSGLISFRIDWFDLPEVQGTLKSLLQHHNSKASVLQCSAFFMAQLSHPYMINGKTIALTLWTFVGKVMSLLF